MRERIAVVPLRDWGFGRFGCIEECLFVCLGEFGWKMRIRNHGGGGGGNIYQIN